MPPSTDNYTPYISYLQALILGLVQGVTEFLPVSSTAHMRILPALLNHYYPSWPNDTGAAFSAIAQLGPMVGIIAYFRKDLARYLMGLGRSLQKGKLFPAGDRRCTSRLVCRVRDYPNYRGRARVGKAH